MTCGNGEKTCIPIETVRTQESLLNKRRKGEAMILPHWRGGGPFTLLVLNRRLAQHATFFHLISNFRAFACMYNAIQLDIVNMLISLFKCLSRDARY